MQSFELYLKTFVKGKGGGEGGYENEFWWAELYLQTFVTGKGKGGGRGLWELLLF